MREYFLLPFGGYRIKKKIHFAFIFMAVVLGTTTTTTDAENAICKSLYQKQHVEQIDYRCFDNEDYGTVNKLHKAPIGLLVSHHVTHQLMTRIFAIFLREKLHYTNVSLIPIKHDCSHIDVIGFDSEKINREFMMLINSTIKMVANLEMWTPALLNTSPSSIYDSGSGITPGRYGWFVPEDLVPKRDKKSYETLQYEIFLDPTSPYYKNYIINDELLDQLRNGTEYEEYISPNCINRSCVTLLSEYYVDTNFVKYHIENLYYTYQAGYQRNKMGYINILWLGEHLFKKVAWLHNLFKTNPIYKTNMFIVVHYQPSDIIDSEIKYRYIVMPNCEDMPFMNNFNCKYELTSLRKYATQDFRKIGQLSYALRKFDIIDYDLKQLLGDLNQERQLTGSYTTTPSLYNKVACNWLKKVDPSPWIDKEDEITLYIGGIFPIIDVSRGHHNLVDAFRGAVNAIQNNKNVLSNYKLIARENDGHCKADYVMRSFIHYLFEQNLLGVLGPACSETVEPIAGISKHANMTVISYSAEGASFVDRNAYPYFFRTIGSNWQYVPVYISLFKYLGWRRLAALTEDGQKYSEYISHMESSIKHHDVELIMNRKFLHDITAANMNKYLLDFKEQHAKIIIADVHGKHALMVLCEAYKLEMTAYQGYVWFFPSWLSIDYELNNETCTKEQLQHALNGHFSLRHSPFGKPEAEMQENITIGEWMDNYYRNNVKNETISNYFGFTYDAVWAYALAADKVLKEDRDAAHNFRSENVMNRFLEFIWQTDFEGLSGRVRFGQGGSRITDINIQQWIDSKYVDVGDFIPEVVGSGINLHAEGGELILKDELIEWLSGSQPDDGTYDCNFSGLAVFLHTDCETAAFISTAFMCLLIVIVLSLTSFLFWKRRYDSKLKISAKIMKNFGIDLLSPSQSKCNTLDKWEVSKDNVVRNRRLGKGAFGDVFGGEARIGGIEWSSVAVKTLRAGASMEDRLDFLSEAEAMKQFNHNNIVKLLGVCLQSEPISTIMEFMLYRDLKTFLLERRNMVNEKCTDDSDISSKRLTLYAIDVAQGLAYLAERKYVHRDIACRNCLVDSQRVVKIGDFGMSRPTLESDYYRFNRKGKLPVRWMAPESLSLGMFTPASDVWAYGMVLFEIITFGSYPYQGMTNNQVMEYVKRGHRMEIPIGAKPPLEALIKACWSQESKKRPTADEIMEYISNYPRLLTPCLDFPGASVEMSDYESDQLIPNAYTCFDRQIPKETVLSRINDLGLTLKLPSTIAAPTSLNIDENASTTPDGYSVMAPLLMSRESESSTSSQSSYPADNFNRLKLT